MDSMQHSYDFVLVALSYVVSVFGSYTALQLARQISNGRGGVRWSWVAASAFAMGGGAIWSMHFIGMLAFDMGMAVSYDLPLTLLSMLVAIVLTGVGLWIVGTGLSWPRLLVAGMVMGAGVATMHYMGMAAMRMRGYTEWNTTIVAISIVIAVVAATAALWIAFRVSGLVQMIGSALVMGVAVCGMHYTGMVAAKMVRDPSRPAPEEMALSADLLAYTIFLISIVILTLGLTFSGGSRRALRAESA